MKKQVFFILAFTVLMLVVFTGSAFATEYDYYQAAIMTVGEKYAVVNNNVTTIDVAPYIKQGRTLVPLRFAGEALGATVNWDTKSQSATIIFKNKKIRISIGQESAEVNGNLVELDVPAELNTGRTFVPIRFTGENLGAKVRYHDGNIMISHVDRTGWIEFKEARNGLAIQYPPDWKLYSNSETSFKLESPQGAIINFYTEEKDVNTVLEEKKKLYSGGEWNVVLDRPLTKSEWPYKAMNLTASSVIDDNILLYDGYFFNVGDSTYTWEFIGDNYLDMCLAYDIIMKDN